MKTELCGVWRIGCRWKRIWVRAFRSHFWLIFWAYVGVGSIVGLEGAVLRVFRCEASNLWLWASVASWSLVLSLAAAMITLKLGNEVGRNRKD